MKLETLNDLFLEQLKDLYNAENQIINILPKMEAKASHPELKEAFRMHLEETKEQVQRLTQIFQQLEIDGSGNECEAMQGILKEGEELMSKDADPDVLDAGLIAAAQRVEHYEIAGYGTACTYAKQLGYTEALELLKVTINEEKMTDEKLSIIAETNVNLDAEH